VSGLNQVIIFGSIRKVGRLNRKGIMKRLWFFVLLYLYLFSSTAMGCTGGAAPGKTNFMVFNDPDKPIVITVGQQFSVVLDSNPTTGYQWQIAEPLNESMVLLVGTDYQATPTNRVGAGGRQIFNFQALGAGKTSIGLAYHRSWEKGVLPVKTVTFSVTVCVQ
jgi:predicted secreted protein